MNLHIRFLGITPSRVPSQYVKVWEYLLIYCSHQQSIKKSFLFELLNPNLSEIRSFFYRKLIREKEKDFNVLNKKDKKEEV